MRYGDVKMEEISNELYHHGTKGMHWGIRLYQNKDGSLTALGRKRYGTKTNFEKVQAAKRYAKEGAKKDRARAAANARTEAEVAKYKRKAGILSDEDEAKLAAKAERKEARKEAKAERKSEKAEKKQLKKDEKDTTPISEMTNKEIKERIERIQLENQLKSLMPTPEKSRGRKFIDNFLDKASSAIVDVATDNGKKYVNNKLKELFPELDDKSPAQKRSEKLKRDAEDWSNREKIEKSKRYINGDADQLTSEKLAQDAKDWGNREKIAKSKNYLAGKDPVGNDDDKKDKNVDDVSDMIDDDDKKKKLKHSGMEFIDAYLGDELYHK